MFTGFGQLSVPYHSGWALSGPLILSLRISLKPVGAEMTINGIWLIELVSDKPVAASAMSFNSFCRCVVASGVFSSCKWDYPILTASNS